MRSRNPKATPIAASSQDDARARERPNLTLMSTPGISAVPDSDRVRVLLVQDHAVLASALTGLFDTSADLTVCGVARNGQDAVSIAQSKEPDVVLIDCRLPDAVRPSEASAMRSGAKAPAIVFISAEDTEKAVLDAVDAGAVAFLTKSATGDQIVETVRRAAQGETMIPVAFFAKAIARRRDATVEAEAHRKLVTQFTPRELDVLRLLSQAHNTEAIADILGIAGHTVEWHLRNVIEKLHVHSQLQAVVEAARLGLIEV